MYSNFSPVIIKPKPSLISTPPMPLTKFPLSDDTISEAVNSNSSLKAKLERKVIKTKKILLKKYIYFSFILTKPAKHNKNNKN